MSSLLSMHVAKQAQFNTRQLDLVDAVVLTKRMIDPAKISNKFSKNAETGRLQRDENGTIILDHYSFRVKLADGTTTSLLVRHDHIEAEPTAYTGRKVHIVLAEGDPIPGAENGEFYVNCAKVSFVDDRIYQAN